MYPRSTRTTKRCAACGLTKPIDQFHRDRSRPDGRVSACRTCANAMHATYLAARRAPKPTPETLPPGAKRCTDCQQIKPLSDYTPVKRNTDGRSNRCRACRNAHQRASYAADPTPSTIRGNRWRANHPNYASQYGRHKRLAQRSDPSYDPSAHYRRYKPNLRAYCDQWAARYPERTFAHKAVARALRTGRLTKADACERCGATGRIEGHHPDYAQPLQVIWLCVTCHRRQSANDRSARTLPQCV